MTSGAKRILYIDLSYAVGGSVISLYHLVKGLDRSRYTPQVILRAGNAYAARFRELGVPVITLGSGEHGSADSEREAWSGVRQSRLTRWIKRIPLGEQFVHLVGFYLRIWPTVRREARELTAMLRAARPDLVHLNDVPPVNRAALVAVRKLRLLTLCHLRAMGRWNHLDRLLSRSLRGYICISRSIEDYLLRQAMPTQGLLARLTHGRAAPRWVVYNGVDLDEFKTTKDRHSLRAELGIPAEAEVVGCVGRLIAWKGQRVFLHALAKLRPGRPRLRGLIVGAPDPDGEAYARELVELAHDLGLDGTVIFTGFRADVPDLLRAMDVLVHTSTSPEPFGRVIIEGMAAGTVVIGADAGAVPEIIRDGETGLLVPPGDAQALADAIARVLDNPQERESLRQAARRAVAQEFTVAQYVRGIERVYQEILG